MANKSGKLPDMPVMFDSAAMTEFGRLSGDRNPIHTDATAAAAGGFAGPVVFGGLIVAKISAYLGNVSPGSGCVWMRLDIDFRQPLYVAEPAILHAEEIHANQDVGLFKIGFRLTAGAREIVRATATAIRRQ